MRTKFLLIALVLSATTYGEELLPEIAGFAQTYKTESSDVAAQKTVALDRTKPPYLAALDAADKAATASGNVAAVAAIAREREQVAKGGMGQSMPSELPKNLGSYRRSYLSSRERVDAEFAQRQKAADATYLRNLATLQTKAAANPALATQITDEKQKMAAGIHGPLTDLTIGIDGTRWKEVGGKEVAALRFDHGKLNATWKYETPKPDAVHIIWNPNSSVTYTLGKDGKTLLENGKPKYELLTPREK